MKKRMMLLISFLRWKMKLKDTKILVFFSNCDSVEFFFRLFSVIRLPKIPLHLLRKNQTEEFEGLVSVPFFKLHGNLSQDQRTATFHEFRSTDSSAILFCTDVAARGLDMNVQWIVQFDPPSDPRAYIHRIGRTARIGQEGNAVVFVSPEEKTYIDILNSKNMNLSEIHFDTVLMTLSTNLEINTKRNPDIEVGALQYRIQNLVNENKDKELQLHILAVKAFQSYVRSYATHTKATRHIFNIKNLHLGHVSKSFGLLDTPATFSNVIKSHKEETKSNNIEKPQKPNWFKANINQATEFGDGII
jgi:ATP-dependent RNA helicase DDX31/DBP7